MGEKEAKTTPYVMEIDDEDSQMKRGWCISCGWNTALCLSGGTINWGSGATCTSPDRLKEDDAWEENLADMEEGETPYALYYRLETIVVADEANCKHWKRGLETPLRYGVKQVKEEESNHCPYCEKTMEAHEGSSVMYHDWVCVVTCAYCHWSYFYIDHRREE